MKKNNFQAASRFMAQSTRSQLIQAPPDKSINKKIPVVDDQAIPNDLDIWRLAVHFETAKVERCRIHLSRDEMTKRFEIEAAQQSRFIEVSHPLPRRQELSGE